MLRIFLKVKTILKKLSTKGASPKITPQMQANRYALCSKDCREAGEYLESLLELRVKDESSGTSEFFTHQKGLLVSAIIAYSRAFMFSYGGELAASKVKVNLGQVFENNREKIELHELILTKRNKAVAHSDWEYHKTELVEVTNTSTLRSGSIVDYQQGIDLNLFMQITETMEKHFRFQAYDRDVAYGKIE